MMEVENKWINKMATFEKSIEERSWALYFQIYHLTYKNLAPMVMLIAIWFVAYFLW